MATTKARQSLFGLGILKKKFELIPLVGILGVACVGAAAYSFYAIYQKPDVRLNKFADQPPWEKVNPEQPQKLVTLNQKYRKIPELEALRKEIGSYKY
ncbi:NDUFA4 family protein [Erythrobacter sp. SN021]|uniref:NDUFA4 family protein n=1 Tax=Erythrobacter sp. SN021 TaxID=2912574 RepID=UPI001F32860E|nr:NDUFA4 family protein [Erythrobacter sp. SN021]MCF8884065.1 NDUFA4 family protein [Erythrobacter sp. SN021]